MTTITAEFGKTDKKIGEKLPWIGLRHMMSFLLLLALGISYTMRVNLSIGIVAMVDKNNTNTDFMEFDWDLSTQSTLLGSFFWGYAVGQIPGGWLTQVLGPKWVLFTGTAISTVATLISPAVVTYADWPGLSALRVIAGISQGALFPSAYAVLSKWAPPNERGFLSSISLSGGQFGTIVGMATGGVLASSDGGWPSLFYVFGGCGIVWCIVWFIVASSTPSENRFISQSEKEYILSALEGASQEKVTHRTPWAAIFKSLPVWAIIIAYSCETFGFYTMLTEMPTYLKTVLGFDIKSNGLLSALPYLTMAVLTNVFGLIADLLVKHGWLRLVWSRKLFNTIGFWGPAAALIGLAYISKEQAEIGVGLLIGVVGLNGACVLGFQINQIDLSPNFSSSLNGLIAGIANIMTILTPIIIGAVVTNEGSIDQWRIVFWIAAALYFFGNIVYCIIGSADIQPWNDPLYQCVKKEDEGQQEKQQRIC